MEDSVEESDGCLAYINANGEWECEDVCLERREDNLLCGVTAHFTSFAVLLTGQGKGASACGDNNNRMMRSSDVCLAASSDVVCRILHRRGVVRSHGGRRDRGHRLVRHARDNLGSAV